MKTKIRTTEYKDKYGHMHIQILTPRYTGARYLEPIGEITFQKNLFEQEARWYGIHFVINTDRAEYIQKMANLAKFIKKNRSGHNAQPEEIIQLIGGVEHIHFDSEFIPVSDKGKSIYKVIREGSLYDKITAPNIIVAEGIMDKLKIVGARLEFDKVISF